MEQDQFITVYSDYYQNVLRPTYNELKQLAEDWRSADFWKAQTDSNELVVPTPIQDIHKRIKRVESVVDKILRKPESFPDGLERDSITTMSDTVGIRIVTYFFHDLMLVHKMLQSDKRLIISAEDPPVAYMNSNQLSNLGMFEEIDCKEKASGYLSIHYIVKLANSEVPEDSRPWFEIQLRTLVENTWGEIEHQLGYKPEKTTALTVRQQFRLIGNYLNAVDMHFEYLRSELQYLQGVTKAEGSQPLNPENFPLLLHEYGLVVTRKEIDGLLKLLFSRGIETIDGFVSVATPANIETINNRYRVKTDKPPIVFELIANLANLKDCYDAQRVNQRIDAQIELNNTWYELKNPKPSE